MGDRVRLSDLPRHVQDKIRAGQDPVRPFPPGATITGRPGPSSGPTAPGGNQASAGGATFRCHACGETFTAWAPAERHGNHHGHHRIEWAANNERGGS